MKLLKKILTRLFCNHTYKYVHASYRTFGSCSDFEECSKCGKIKKSSTIDLLLKTILILLFLGFFYAAIEPYLYLYTGFGFIYEYNEQFVPILKR